MVVICKWCNKDMNNSEGCNAHVVKVGKATFVSVVYGKETNITQPKRRKHCGDCNATRGHRHHYRCDLEECPVCHEQYLTCEHGVKGQYSGTRQSLL